MPAHRRSRSGSRVRGSRRFSKFSAEPCSFTNEDPAALGDHYLAGVKADTAALAAAAAAASAAPPQCALLPRPFNGRHVVLRLWMCVRLCLCCYMGFVERKIGEGESVSVSR